MNFSFCSFCKHNLKVKPITYHVFSENHLAKIKQQEVKRFVSVHFVINKQSGKT